MFLFCVVGIFSFSGSDEYEKADQTIPDSETKETTAISLISNVVNATVNAAVNATLV